MITVPGMLMVGACAGNLGKTTFACALIEKFGSQCDIVGVKVTTVDSFNESHHPDMARTARYRVVEEQERDTDKDTARMLASGATRSLWLQVWDEYLEDGVNALLNTLGPDAVSICESTRARRFVVPGAYIVLRSAHQEDVKPSVREMMHDADHVVVSDGSHFDIDMSDIQLLGDRWTVRMQATAIILAGGRSTRMGQDKSMLPVAGKPMIQHVYEQLRPHFHRVLISSNSPSRHAFLGAPIVPDEQEGKGPLAGLVSALKASSDTVNFVIACDVPNVDIELVKGMIRRLGSHDATVACKEDGRPEPLFAVYAKSALPVLEQALSSGKYRVTDALARCRVQHVPCTNEQIQNINTMHEYRQHVGKVTNGEF